MKLFLTTWKPEFGSYTKEQFNELKKILRQDGHVKTPWTMRASEVNIGDQIILFRQGEVTGLYGFGHVTGSDEIIEKDDSRKFEVTLCNLRDSIDQPFFSKKDLVSGGIKQTLLNAQSSAQGSVPEDQVDIFQKVFISKYGFGLERLSVEYCIKQAKGVADVQHHIKRIKTLDFIQVIVKGQNYGSNDDRTWYFNCDYPDWRCWQNPI